MYNYGPWDWALLSSSSDKHLSEIKHFGLKKYIYILGDWLRRGEVLGLITLQKGLRSVNGNQTRDLCHTCELCYEASAGRGNFNGPMNEFLSYLNNL